MILMNYNAHNTSFVFCFSYFLELISHPIIRFLLFDWKPISFELVFHKFSVSFIVRLLYVFIWRVSIFLELPWVNRYFTFPTIQISKDALFLVLSHLLFRRFYQPLISLYIESYICCVSHLHISCCSWRNL